jgi:hypothetical protein
MTDVEQCLNHTLCQIGDLLLVIFEIVLNKPLRSI